MALAHVYAMVSPKNTSVLFVRVLDDSGSDLKVVSNWLTVTVAATAQATATVESYPTVSITGVAKGPGSFTAVSLGSVKVENPYGHTDELPTGDLSPLVYAIEYAQPKGRGMTIDHYGATIVRL